MTVEQLESLLISFQSTKDGQKIAKDILNSIDFQDTMNPSTIYTVEIMEKEIQRAIENEVKELVFNRKSIASIPASIGQLTFVKALSMNNCQLKDLPPEMSQLKSLQRLDLGNNQLEVFPDCILLKQLEVLNLEHNKIVKITGEQILKLESLKELILFSNQLKAFPKEVVELKHLKKLDIECNYIKKLEFTEKDFQQDNVAFSYDMNIKTANPKKRKVVSKKTRSKRVKK